MRLVHSETGLEVRPGDKVVTFRGETGKLSGSQLPKSLASTGRILIIMDETNVERCFFPSVCNLEWKE